MWLSVNVMVRVVFCPAAVAETPNETSRKRSRIATVEVVVGRVLRVVVVADVLGEVG